MKSSLVHFIVASAASAIVLVGYGVWYAALAAKSVSVANLQDQIDTKMETARRVASARAAMAEIADDESIVRSYFVSETSVVAFISALEAQGHAQGASVQVLSVSSGAARTQPTLAFSLTISGTFDAVMRTVGAIEYAPYNLTISAFSIGRDDKNNWQANVGLTVGSVAPVKNTP